MGEHAVPQPVLQDDLQSFFTAYARAWTERDPDEIMRFMTMPLTRVTSAKQRVIEDDEAAEGSLLRLLERFEANGIENARLATIEVVAVTDTTVEVNVHWELLGANGEPVLGYDVGYTLLNQGRHRWQITAIQEDEQNKAIAEAGWSERDAA
jgi:hypothetical protein